MPSTSLLYILINKGMGAGIIIDNRVFRGANGTAGEVGSLLIDSGKTSCDRSCGFASSFEAFFAVSSSKGE